MLVVIFWVFLCLWTTIKTNQQKKRLLKKRDCLSCLLLLFLILHLLCIVAHIRLVTAMECSHCFCLPETPLNLWLNILLLLSLSLCKCADALLSSPKHNARSHRQGQSPANWPPPNKSSPRWQIVQPLSVSRDMMWGLKRAGNGSTWCLSLPSYFLVVPCCCWSAEAFEMLQVSLWFSYKHSCEIPIAVTRQSFSAHGAGLGFKIAFRLI